MRSLVSVVSLLFVYSNFVSTAGAAPSVRKPASQFQTKSQKPTKPQKNSQANQKAKHGQRTDPISYLQTRTRATLTELKSRPLRAATASSGKIIEAETSLTKASWLATIYKQQLVANGNAERMLSDKRLMASVLDTELGKTAREFYPKTLGLKEFLASRRLVDASGKIVASGEAIEEALHQEFPSGFVVRPAVGVAPSERGRGLFSTTDAFIVALLKDKSILYHPSFLHKPIESHILGRPASGEAIVIQEDLVTAAETKAPLKFRYFQETRIHTYEGRVVADAVPSRWVQSDLLKPEDIQRAEAFVQKFLSSLPAALLNRQAWGVDVAVMDNGELRINDIVTNRGDRIQWSSYLEQPQVIAAYTKHFEGHANLHLTGLSGALTRFGFSNYFPYWAKRIEKAKPGLPKVLAYFPPFPW